VVKQQEHVSNPGMRPNRRTVRSRGGHAADLGSTGAPSVASLEQCSGTGHLRSRI